MRVRTRRVPAGYCELEYIESTGTQYIDSGVEGDSTSYIEFSFQYTAISTDYNRIFGSRSNVSHLLNMRSSASTGTSFYMEWTGGAYSVTGPSIDLQKHTIILDGINNVYKFDGIVKSYQFICSSNTGNLYLFGTNQGGTDGSKRFYYYKHFKNNTIIQNFIPCERLSDSKPGMYDIVNNAFYINEGTGEFIKGPYKDSYKLSLLRLPPTYQEVEYIQSDGNQWINTNYANTSTPYQINCDMEITGSAVRDYWFGQNQGHGSMMYNGLYNNNSLEFNWITVSRTANNRCIMTQKLSSDGTTVDITMNGVTVTKPVGTNDSTGNFLIFACNPNSSSVRKYGSGLRLYSFKIHEGYNIIRDFIPCYRKSDNVIGLYDIVEGKFYTNQGSGTFTKGNDVKNLGMFTPKMIMYNYNQILSPNRHSTQTINNVTITNNGDGSYTINGTATATAYDIVEDYPFITGHKYYIKQNYSDSIQHNVNSWFFGVRDGASYRAFEESIFTAANGSPNDDKGTAIRVEKGIQVNNVTIKPIIIDLTDWYGVGKEPSTIEEFKERFYRDYYGYCPTAIRLTENMINAEPIYGYNQLFVSTTSTANWISNGTNLTFNSDGSVTMVRYNNNNYDGIQMVSSKASPYYANHKYFWSCSVYADTKVGKGAGFGLNLYSNGTGYAINESQDIPEKTWYKDEKIFTPTKNSSGTIYPWIFMNQRSDRTVGDSVTVKDVMFIDLTDWYGAGSEPETVAEFKNSFPYKYYQYMKKTLLNKYMINELGTN